MQVSSPVRRYRSMAGSTWFENRASCIGAVGLGGIPTLTLGLFEERVTHEDCRCQGNRSVRTAGGCSPDTVKKFKAIGADVVVEPGAGIKSGLPDSEYIAAGATVSADALKD